MSDMQQYTCPQCYTVGAHGKDSPAPLCHRCDYKVTMMKSHNGTIIDKEFPDEWTEHLEKIVEEFFKRNPKNKSTRRL